MLTILYSLSKTVLQIYIFYMTEIDLKHLFILWQIV